MQKHKNNNLIIISIIIIIVIGLFIIFLNERNINQQSLVYQNDIKIQKSNKIQKVDNLLIVSSGGIDFNLFDKIKSKEDILSERKVKYFDEIANIETYYSKDPFYEFYFILSIKNKKIKECELIKEENKRKICKKLFNLKGNKDEFIKSFLELRNEDKYSAEAMFQVYNSIINNKCMVSNENYYFACEKILNKNINVREMFINYSRLKYSDYNWWRNYYKKLSKYWGYDEGFNFLLKEVLLK